MSEEKKVEQDERGDAPLSLIPELVKQDQRAVSDALIDMGDAMVAWRTEVGKYREITSLSQSAFSDGYEAGIAAILRARAASTSVNVAQMSRDDLQGKALSHGFKYWRAPDAHGITGTAKQAENLIADLVGVEVEITK